MLHRMPRRMTDVEIAELFEKLENGTLRDDGWVDVPRQGSFRRELGQWEDEW